MIKDYAQRARWLRITMPWLETTLDGQNATVEDWLGAAGGKDGWSSKSGPTNPFPEALQGMVGP